MLSMAKVTVRSVANTAGAVITDMIKARALKLFFMGRVSSWCQAESSSGAT
jgi:hypothetical protein